MLVLTPEEIAEQLARLLPTGATVKALTENPALLGLAVIAAKSPSDDPKDLAVAAIQVIHQAATDVDSDRNGVAASLLGLADNTKRLSAAKRRQRAAEKAGYNAEHFAKTKVTPALEATAEAIYAIDSGYRLRHKHRIEAESTPTESGIRIDWLAQHQAYRRIWTPLTGTRNDVLVFAKYLAAEKEDQPAIADRLCSISWHWAKYLNALDQFVEEDGGLWLLADKEAEVTAADSLYLVGFYSPLGETDNSWLRVLLNRSERQELDTFTDELIEAGDRRRELMNVWIDWVKSALTKDGEIAVGTDLAKWLDATDTYLRLIDEDWYKVADYYRHADIDLDQINIKKLWMNRQ